MQTSSSTTEQFTTPTVPYSFNDSIADLAEKKLRELVEDGNLDAIKLAISCKPFSCEVSC